MLSVAVHLVSVLGFGFSFSTCPFSTSLLLSRLKLVSRLPVGRQLRWGSVWVEGALEGVVVGFLAC